MSPNKLNKISLFIIFISVFWCVFFFEDALNYFNPTSSKGSQYTNQFEEASPNSFTVINGQKINVINGFIKKTAKDFYDQIKNEISIDPNKKLIHSSIKGNKFLITYKLKEKTFSIMILGNADGTARYQIYKSGGKLKDGGELPDLDIPHPPDAVSLMNLKGQKGKLFYSYNTHLTSDEVIAFYRSKMKPLGWKEEEFKLPPNSSVFNSKNQHDTVEIAFMKNRKSFIISIKMDPENAISMVTVLKS
ncbi:MAG: hypothetical protein COA79_00155 [Planctomycetota bacterium]|nr:MAG: hypothetical protein COA79_00155 [Planctomycetota bacterium]